MSLLKTHYFYPTIKQLVLVLTTRLSLIQEKKRKRKQIAIRV